MLHLPREIVRKAYAEPTKCSPKLVLYQKND